MLTSAIGSGRQEHTTKARCLTTKILYNFSPESQPMNLRRALRAGGQSASLNSAEMYILLYNKVLESLFTVLHDVDKSATPLANGGDTPYNVTSDPKRDDAGDMR